MEVLWFWIITFMIITYVILDGFDLGIGILHLFLTKNDPERSLLLKTIAHAWDGNEVWLLAAGGTLFMIFPPVYAAAFGGFYLPLMILLWLLMLRGGGIELRHYLHHTLWRKFWDTIFCSSSILLSFFFGAALGNIVRGVPLTKDGYFFEPLWTSFTVVAEPGILDWFTVIMGIVGLSTLALHGANYIAMKTSGEIQERARLTGKRIWWIVLLTSLAAFLATWSIHPDLWNNYYSNIGGFIFPIGGMAGIIGMYIANSQKKDTAAFCFSTIFIAAMLAATAFAIFPNLLIASTEKTFSMTIYNAVTNSYALTTGLYWWIPGIILAAIYFIYLFRSFRGKFFL
jgi:cytochrome d ubiquinol oxidase subunit II